MSLFRCLTLCIALASSVPALARLNTGLPNESTTQTPRYFNHAFIEGQAYVNNRTTQVKVLGATDDAGDEIRSLRGQLLSIPQGSILQIVDSSNFGQDITFSFDLENMMAAGIDVSELPNLVKVSARELLNGDFTMLDLVALTDENGDTHIQLPAAVAGPGGKKAAMTYCLQDVRIFASSSNCNAEIVRLEKAADAMAAYLGTGKWTKISKNNWSDYPKCTACFYGGGRMDCSGGTACGHAAIKINSNQWKGAGTRAVPGLPDRNGIVNGVKRTPYKFQGCIIPKHLAQRK